VAGDENLTNELKTYVTNEVQNKSVFLYHMAGNIIEAKLPATGNNKEIDVKKLLMPVTAFARVYSLKTGIPENNTLLRLSKIRDKNLIPVSFFNNITHTYRFLMQLRLDVQNQAIHKGEKPTNSILAESLNEFELVELKKSISIIADMQTRLSADFKGVL
jgi:CBS domain-containing protein